MAKDGIDIIKAILHLVPEASFRIENDDLATLEWNCDLPRPTDEAIKAALPVAAKAEADATKAKEVAKAALLERLGITSEEAKLLLA
jgi:hypothetical protein